MTGKLEKWWWGRKGEGGEARSEVLVVFFLLLVSEVDVKRKKKKRRAAATAWGPSQLSYIDRVIPIVRRPARPRRSPAEHACISRESCSPTAPPRWVEPGAWMSEAGRPGPMSYLSPFNRPAIAPEQTWRIGGVRGHGRRRLSRAGRAVSCCSARSACWTSTLLSRARRCKWCHCGCARLKMSVRNCKCRLSMILHLARTTSPCQAIHCLVEDSCRIGIGNLNWHVDFQERPVSPGWKAGSPGGPYEWGCGAPWSGLSAIS